MEDSIEHVEVEETDINIEAVSAGFYIVRIKLMREKIAVGWYIFDYHSWCGPVGNAAQTMCLKK